MQIGFYQPKHILRVIISAALLFVVGCGNSSIVGKWRMSGSSDATVWEFKSNGAVFMGNISGRYKFGDNNRIKIETPFATSVYQLEISGDRLTLREPGGSKPKFEFTRISEAQR